MKKKLNIRLLISSTIVVYLLVCTTLTAQTPGGIAGGLQLWLKANAGTTTAGANLTTWQDQSIAATPVTVNGSPDLTNPGYNYNPYINFTLSSATGGDFLRIPTTNYQSFFWTAQLANLTRPSTHMATYDGVTLGMPCNGCPIHGGENGGVIPQYHELGYGNGTFQTAGMWRKNGTSTGISYNTPHSGKFDIVTALGGSAVVTNVLMGGQNSNLPAFDGRLRDWLGPVGEIIAYSGPITAVQANLVESYLAVKYGITLGGNGSTTVAYNAPNGTTIWAANTGYHNDVAGIGNDNAIEALVQPKSHSINTPADAVIMANGNFAAPVALSDGQYLLWGNNYGAFTFICQNFTHGGPATALNALWGRTWRTQKTGALAGNAIVEIDMTMFQGPSGLGTTNNADVRLLIDDNTAFGDGSAGEHTYTANAGFGATGGQIYFTVPYSDIQNGIGYFSLAFIATAPTVSIAASSTNICAGASVTFTATPTNGGTLPTYQWQVNGVNAGTNSAIFTTTTLNNNDVVTVILTTNTTCVLPPTVTSNSITITVGPALVPSVTISTPSTTFCTGTSATFTATPINGGTLPAYQWQVNGVNVGSNSATYTSSTLNNGDVVTVILTPNSLCVFPTSATSNAITITISSVVVPSVTIVATTTIICAGTPVTFTSTPTNAGTTPTYQWQVNGANQGTNSTTFTSSNLSNADVVTVVLTSSLACASPATATSAGITITVSPTPIADFSYDMSGVNSPTAAVHFNDNSVSATSWLWNFGTGGSSIIQNPDYTFPGQGIYTVTLTVSNGLCSDSISKIIQINSLSTYYIPNSFTPNEDGTNDVFCLKGIGIYKENFEMSIYNRWGELVFYSTDILIGWDGSTINPVTPAEEGVYTYQFNFVWNDSNGKAKMTKIGKVTLVR